MLYLLQRHQLPIFFLNYKLLGEGSFVSLPFYPSYLRNIYLWMCMNAYVKNEMGISFFLPYGWLLPDSCFPHWLMCMNACVCTRVYVNINPGLRVIPASVFYYVNLLYASITFSVGQVPKASVYSEFSWLSLAFYSPVWIWELSC